MHKLRGHVSHFEVASVSFDQYILTIALREFDTRRKTACGMVHVTFQGVIGFKMLYEGDLLNYPFPVNPGASYWHKITEDGWWIQEKLLNNLSTETSKEYLIASENECVCVLSIQDPVTLFA